MNTLRPRILVLTLIFFSIYNNTTAINSELILKRKADFIIQISSLISFPNSPDSETYKIGIYGKGSEIKSLLNELKSRDELKINGKEVKFYSFRNTRNIEPVNLIYVSGDSKIRISDLNAKLGKHPYIMLTENFPFGTSMLNFIVNKKSEIFFELQEEVLKFKGASIKPGLLNAKNRIKNLEDWDLIMAAAVSVINNQKHTIKTKSNEIIEHQRVIRSQRITIVVSILAIMLISGLLYVLLKVNNQKKEALKNLYDSINYATYIQKSILPSKSIFKQYFKDYFILYKPKSMISGDFYWFETKHDKILFAVADCTGHGIPGAMLSIMCSQSLTRAAREVKTLSPALILDKVTNYIEEYFSKSHYDINDGMDLALCILDTTNKTLEYAGAKCPLYLFGDDKLKIIKPDRYSIGNSSNTKEYTNHTVKLEEFECLYIFSDGYPDQFGGPSDKKYTYKKFRELLSSHHKLPMEKQKEILSGQMTEWMNGNEQTDDITILGIKL